MLLAVYLHILQNPAKGYLYNKKGKEKKKKRNFRILFSSTETGFSDFSILA